MEMLPKTELYSGLTYKIVGGPLLDIDSNGKKIHGLVFSGDSFDERIGRMQKEYHYPGMRETITFRPATTRESILFRLAEGEPLAGIGTLILGPAASTKKGIYLNPPMSDNGKIMFDEEELFYYKQNCSKIPGIYLGPKKDEKGNAVVDEEVMEWYHAHCKEENSIYYGNNDFAFVPTEAFGRGNVKLEYFFRQGLARALEHTTGERAEGLFRLNEISNLRADPWVGASVGEGYPFCSGKPNAVITLGASPLTTGESNMHINADSLVQSSRSYGVILDNNSQPEVIFPKRGIIGTFRRALGRD